MKKIYLLLLSTGLLFGASLFAANADIRLSGRKDRVLSSKVRVLVLDVAEDSLNHEDPSFIASIEGIKNPYASQDVVVDPIATETATVISKAPEVVEAPVVYDDASILRVVGKSFSKQVRGTLARGAMNYLQLQGGGMIKPGTSFPAKIPELEGESFTVTITEIDSSSYTLKLKETSLTFSLDGSSDASSSATRDSSL